ncbi:hypothetical protein BVRB_4g097220, partial [Beta vulgaris subsp. vulgaris]
FFQTSPPINSPFLPSQYLSSGPSSPQSSRV